MRDSLFCFFHIAFVIFRTAAHMLEKVESIEGESGEGGVKGERGDGGDAAQGLGSNHSDRKCLVCFFKIRAEDFKKSHQNTKAEETLVRTKRAKKKGKKGGGDGHKRREKEGDEDEMAGNILKGQ